jgi:hypothetical protein
MASAAPGVPHRRELGAAQAPGVGQRRAQVQAHLPQPQMHQHAERAADGQGNRKAGQTQRRQRPGAMHQQPGQSEVAGMHHRDHAQHIGAAKMGAHDAGLGGVPGIEQHGGCEPAQQRCRQR